MFKDKEYYLLHHFYTSDANEAREFAHRVVLEHKINFSIYNDENSDMITIEFDNKKHGILLPATVALASMWLVTQLDIWTLGEVIR